MIDMNREKLLEIAKPIIFSTLMVRAILDGKKTMTRRVVKFPEGTTGRLPPSGARDYLYYPGGIKRARYKAGDILWVRETWAWLPSWNCDSPACSCCPDFYKGERGHFIYKENLPDWEGGWKPSRYMPKAAARIFLRVTADSRFERLQDMDIDEMIKEGVKVDDITTTQGIIEYRVVDRFEELWDSINAKRGYPYEANPWVEVVEFEKIGG